MTQYSLSNEESDAWAKQQQPLHASIFREYAQEHGDGTAVEMEYA